MTEKLQLLGEDIKETEALLAKISKELNELNIQREAK